jgi:hypothetical protein
MHYVVQGFDRFVMPSVVVQTDSPQCAVFQV